MAKTTASVKTKSKSIRPLKRLRRATTIEASGGDWLCASCLNRVANDKDRFKYDGKCEFTFCNPEGIRFEIIVFSQVVGCREIGAATLEHTWFPQHAWSFCQCDRCQMHLGWFYRGPHDFAGLIKNRLVRSRCVWN